MTISKNHLYIVLTLAVLAAVGTMMDSRHAAAADGGPTVTVGAPLPLPVTGTVAATQSGGWSVGINGTPNVNVTNPATAPVLSLNLSDPGRIPYQSGMNSALGACTTSICVFLFGPVPANHRLVVEHVTGVTHFTSAQAAALVTVAPKAGEGFEVLSTFQVPSTAVSSNQSFAAFDQPVHFYVDPAKSFTVAIVPSLSNIDTTPIGFVTVTGYLLDCTAGPCASIASF